MSIPTDCEEKIFENISLPDSTSKPTSKDEHAAEIVRTPNAFLLYRSEKQLALRNKMNAPLPHDISRIVSLWWRATTPETKEYYRSLSHTDAIRQKASQVTSTVKRKRTTRKPKAPIQQLLSMGHLRVTLPQYHQFVEDASDVMGIKHQSTRLNSSTSFPLLTPSTPSKPYKPLLHRYRMQYFTCHCQTCELPISSLAKPIDDYDRK